MNSKQTSQIESLIADIKKTIRTKINWKKITLNKCISLHVDGHHLDGMLRF